VFEATKTTVSNIWNAIKSAIETVVNTVKNLVSTGFNAVKDTVTTVFNTVKSTAETVWNGIKTTISNVVNGIKTTVSNVFSSIKTAITSPLESAKSTVSNIFGNLKSTMSNAINGAKDAVGNAISKIKNFFNFKITWPKIPMPRFSISPSGWKIGDLLKGSIPKLSISWNAEGGIFDSPTIFPTVRGLQGVGEAGAEAIIPLDSFYAHLDAKIDQITNDDSAIQLNRIYNLMNQMELRLDIDSREFTRTAIAPNSNEITKYNNLRTSRK
jgi:phage-related protein